VNKSPGPDDSHILCEVRNQIVTALRRRMIFETSFSSGIILRGWKFANTVPVHKKGSKAEVNNYSSRPNEKLLKSVCGIPC